MKEDMGKIQKDNKQGVVCIRCVRVLCRPSSRYRKAGTGLYTEETRLFIALFWCKKVPFLFLYHNTGRACHEKILEVFQRAAKRRIFYY